MAIDFEAEGLLDETSGEAREARLELLEELEADGASLEELRRADRRRGDARLARA